MKGRKRQCGDALVIWTAGHKNGIVGSASAGLFLSQRMADPPAHVKYSFAEGLKVTAICHNEVVPWGQKLCTTLAGEWKRHREKLKSCL